MIFYVLHAHYEPDNEQSGPAKQKLFRSSIERNPSFSEGSELNHPRKRPLRGWREENDKQIEIQEIKFTFLNYHKRFENHTPKSPLQGETCSTLVEVNTEMRYTTKRKRKIKLPQGIISMQ